MSDKLSQEEIDVLTGNGDLSELEPLKNAFNVCLDAATETLSSITNTPNITYNEAQVEMLSASDLIFDSGDISIRIGLKSGLSGYSFLNLSTKTCENIAASMMGMDDAPVPPNTEPKTNTRAWLPACERSVRKSANSTSSFAALFLSLA